MKAYLNKYYRTQHQLATDCSISVNELMSLVSEGLVPQPSYAVTSNGVFISKVFGEFTVENLDEAKYFHPTTKHWVSLALQESKGKTRLDAVEKLKRQFKANFRDSLAKLDQTTFRLADSFSDSGDPIDSSLEQRTERAWSSFQKGIFGLCVADPSSEYLIAEKEVLQEALSFHHQEFTAGKVTERNKVEILGLIADYERAAMPFSPLEYPKSSRKKLVEDFRRELIDAEY